LHYFRAPFSRFVLGRNLKSKQIELDCLAFQSVEVKLGKNTNFKVLFLFMSIILYSELIFCHVTSCKGPIPLVASTREEHNRAIKA
jgi:hypothetical protein